MVRTINDVVEEGYTTSGQPIVMGGAATRISDPFAVLPDQHPATSTSNSPNVNNSTLDSVSEGESEHSSSQSSPLVRFGGTQVNSQNGKRRRVGVGIDLMNEFNTEADTERGSNFISSEEFQPITNTRGETKSLFMPPCVKPFTR